MEGRVYIVLLFYIAMNDPTIYMYIFFLRHLLPLTSIDINMYIIYL